MSGTGSNTLAVEIVSMNKYWMQSGFYCLGTIQVLHHQRGGWGGQMMMFDDKVGGCGQMMT